MLKKTNVVILRYLLFDLKLNYSNAKQWLEEEKNFMEIKKEFDSTSR